jgi:hypothetical protein
VNTASGTFVIDAIFNEDKKPSVINISQAYARVVSNLKDQNKKDVLIVLLEKALPRTALAVVENDSPDEAAQDLDIVLHNRDARGVVFRLPVDGKGGDSGVRPYFNGQDYDFGNLEVEIKSFSAEAVEGHIKSNVSSQQADINFAVKLKPDVWTGGNFYQQPPTKLAPGQASGQFGLNGTLVNLNHAYARLVEFDMFDENKNVFKIWFTQQPVEAAMLSGENANFLRTMKQGGNNFILTYTTNGPDDRAEPALWLVDQLRDGATDEDMLESKDLLLRIPDLERDYAKYDRNNIEGRLYSEFLVGSRNHMYKVDLLFNAAVLPPVAADGPVTAGEGGKALPSDGGAPAKAYLAAIERMRSAKGFDEGIAVWLSVVTADLAGKIKQDIQSLSPQQRQELVDVFAPLENEQLTGGLIKDNKATLRFNGMAQGSKAVEAVNMHLENGEWKIGRREIRVD